jgi:hypothetical protein
LVVLVSGLFLPPLLTPLLACWASSIVEARAPNETIDRQGPYIERWYLARKAMVPLIGGPAAEDTMLSRALIPSEIENVYIHRYLRSDAEDAHDHPWDNVTIVLAGEVVEETPAGTQVLLPGAIVLRVAEQLHAIRSVRADTLTLFVTLQKRREWGFFGTHGWVGWRHYRPMFRDRPGAGDGDGRPNFVDWEGYANARYTPSPALTRLPEWDVVRTGWGGQPHNFDDLAQVGDREEGQAS